MTLFKETVETMLGYSIMGRAQKNNNIQLKLSILGIFQKVNICKLMIILMEAEQVC